MIINCPIFYRNLESPEDPAMVTPERCLSYRELNLQISRTAGFLKESGVKCGDKVFLSLPNSSQLMIIIFALFRLKAIGALFNHKEPLTRLETALQTIAPSHFFDRFPTNPTPHSLFDATELSLEQTATLIWTSGTSGNPKIAAHSLKNHWFSALGSNHVIPIQPGDRWLLNLPLFHVSGVSILFRVFQNGGTVVLNETRNLDGAAAFQTLRPTHVSWVLPQFKKSIESGLSFKGVKAVLIGGSGIPDTLTKKALDLGIPIFKTYGSTEMASQIATAEPHLLKSYPGSSGNCLPYREISVSKTSEILVRGETLFQGYYFEKTITLPLTSDGWFKTGDIGFLKKGILTVLGRKDSRFFSGGETIDPEEIERALLEHPDIDLAVVVPFSHSDFGQRPAAFIHSKKKLSYDKISDFLGEKLAKYKIPDRFFSWPEQQADFKTSRIIFEKLALNLNKNRIEQKLHQSP